MSFFEAQIKTDLVEEMITLYRLSQCKSKVIKATTTTSEKFTIIKSWHSSLKVLKKGLVMTLEEFNKLSDKNKKELLIDAKKVSEHVDEVATTELFQIDGFYIEVSRSVTHRFRKIINTYPLNAETGNS